MDEVREARIRVFLNDPAGRGEEPVASVPPRDTESPPWGFRVEGRAPAPRDYEPDTPEFLHWQMSAALARGKTLWAELFPAAGDWIPGPVLPAVPVSGAGLNAYYDRRALHFFRDEEPETGRIVHSGESPDIVTHEQGHAILDAVRPDLWDAPHFEVAAFHEAFGDLAAIFVAFAEPTLVRAVLGETMGSVDLSNLVSRLAEELGAAVRARYGPDAALPGALRDAVNTFEYRDPKELPDDAPASSLSAEPHSFCRVMTGASWDALVAVFRAQGGRDPAAALAHAAQTTARLTASASESAPAGADFLPRVARRIVREARTSGEESLASALAAAFFQRRLLATPDVTPGVEPDADPDVLAPFEGEPPSPTLLRAIESRLGPERPGRILTRAVRRAGGRRVLRGRRKRDLILRGAEYGPADGAAVEISDSFALIFGEQGYLTASAAHPAAGGDEEDARAFVRFLARRRRIAAEDVSPIDAEILVREGKSHAVIREDDGMRRLRRVWISEGAGGTTKGGET